MKTHITLLALLFTTLSYAQVANQAQQQQSQLDGIKSESANADYRSFTADNGFIVRREKVILEDLKAGFGIFGGIFKTSIEKVIVGEATRLYFNISGYSNSRVYESHIPTNHLKDVLDALEVLLKQSAEDKLVGSKEFDNYFKTEDDFEIGYRTEKFGKKINIYWYLTLERYGVNYRFHFYKEANFFKAVQTMKSAYEAMKNSQ